MFKDKIKKIKIPGENETKNKNRAKFEIEIKNITGTQIIHS